MGGGRAEGLSAIGDGGHAAVSLKSDADGIGSGSLLESDACSYVGAFLDKVFGWVPSSRPETRTWGYTAVR